MGEHLNRRKFLMPFSEGGAKKGPGKDKPGSGILPHFGDLPFLATTLATTVLWGTAATVLAATGAQHGEDVFGISIGEILDVDGVKVQTMGVAHSVDNYFRFRNEFVSRIQTSPFVVLEYFSNSIAEGAIPTTSDSELLKVDTLIEQERNFFAAIGRDCAKEQKDILVVNPLNDDVGNAQSQFLEIYLTLGLPTALLATDVYKFANWILGSKLSRRHILRTIGYVAGFTELASWADDFKHLSYDANQNEGSSLRWNSVDFRDVNSALGIKRLIGLYSEEVTQDQVITVIQGQAHSVGTAKYLKDPSLAETKTILYPHFGAFSNPIRRFKYDSGQNEWTSQEVALGQE